jgi:hypothetical protein
MTRRIIYVLLVIALEGTAAWVSQRWRLEGAVAEARQAAEGEVLFERSKAEAEARALQIVEERERDGKTEGSAILREGKEEGRRLAFEGQGRRTDLENIDLEATKKYYLDPMFGLNGIIDSLKRDVESETDPHQREDKRLVLSILEASQAETRSTTSLLRTEAAKRAAREFSRGRLDGHCVASPVADAKVWGLQ